MDRNKIYEKKARLYPVITSMLIPLILLINLGSNICSEYNNLQHIWNILITIIPASLITAALTYGVKTLSRSTSKILFQFPLFKEDETNMPTTNLLLWSNNLISKQRKEQIRVKIIQEIGLQLMNETQESENENEARLIIADAVKQIREKTRENEILFNYNCNYGFIRNFLGANVWSLILIITIMIYNFCNPIVNNYLIIGALLFSIVFFLIAFIFLKQHGREYARQLFTAFMELKNN